MGAIKVRKYRQSFEIETFLQGGIIGGDISRGVTNLVGQTITFLAPGPAGSVTFTPGADSGLLRFGEIRDQVEAVIPGLAVRCYEGKIVFVESAPNQGVTLAAGSAGGYATLLGTVDINTLAFGPAGTVDTKTLSLEVDGAAQPLITFAAPVNVADLLAQINAIIVGAVATLQYPSGYLTITSGSTGALSKVKVLAGSSVASLGYTALQTVTGAVLNGANAFFGFDADASTSGKVYGKVGDSAPSFIQAYSTNDNVHILYTWE